MSIRDDEGAGFKKQAENKHRLLPGGRGFVCSYVIQIGFGVVLDKRGQGGALPQGSGDEDGTAGKRVAFLKKWRTTHTNKKTGGGR